MRNRRFCPASGFIRVNLDSRPGDTPVGLQDGPSGGGLSDQVFTRRGFQPLSNSRPKIVPKRLLLRSLNRQLSRSNWQVSDLKDPRSRKARAHRQASSEQATASSGLRLAEWPCPIAHAGRTVFRPGCCSSKDSNCQILRGEHGLVVSIPHVARAQAPPRLGAEAEVLAWAVRLS